MLVYIFEYMYIFRGTYLRFTWMYVGHIGIFNFSYGSPRHSIFVLLSGLILHLYILVVITPVCKVTVTFSIFENFHTVPLNWVSYLYPDLLLARTLSPTLYS